MGERAWVDDEPGRKLNQSSSSTPTQGPCPPAFPESTLVPTFFAPALLSPPAMVASPFSSSNEPTFSPFDARLAATSLRQSA